MKNTVFPIYFNETALHLAVENENLDIIQNLVSNDNIDPNILQICKNNYF